MKHQDFKEGMIFFTATGAWKVTDIGRRTVIAIKLDHVPDGKIAGPPYWVAEQVFDEDDFKGCFEEQHPLRKG